jgi:hypothetical protein
VSPAGAVACISVAVWLGQPVAAAAKGEPRSIAVFVTVPAPGVFPRASREAIESAADIARVVGDMREFRLVDRREQADLVIEVLGRGAGSEAFASLTAAVVSGGHVIVDAIPDVATSYWVEARLEAGTTHTTLLVGTASNPSALSPWTDCAAALAGNLRNWTRANGKRLQAVTPEAPPAPQWQAFAGYAWLDDVTDKVTFPAGWALGVAGRLNTWLSVAGDSDGQYETIPSIGSSVQLTSRTVTGGPRVSARLGRFVEFGQVLGGVVWSTGTLFGSTETTRHAVLQPGVGLDYPLSRRWAVRGEIDVRFLVTGHELRVAAGIVRAFR